jgi:predicted glycosyltransferase
MVSWLPTIGARSYRITTVLRFFLNAGYCGPAIASPWIDQDEFMMKFENIDGSNSQVLPESSAQPAPKPALQGPGVWFSDGRPASAKHENNLGGSDSSPKIVLYSHDTFGMGNIRRTLLLSQEFITDYQGASILIITGSPMIHAFRIPEGIDYIKLPCLDRFEAEQYAPRYLPGCPEEVKDTREAILRESVLRFNPDLMVVDKRAAGVDGELLPTLHALRQNGRHTKLVLGVRDILDEPERTRKVLASNGSFDLIDEFYDEVWIYGSKSVFDTVTEYAFPESVVRKTFYCGYLKRPTVSTGRKEGPPRILVTTGGGGDGSDIIEAYLTGLASLPRNIALRSTVIFGPQMSQARRLELLQRFNYMADVNFLDFEADIANHYAESDVVVSQAGYNTVCELLSFSRRAILVPRGQPVREQLIRARLMAERGFFECIEPQDLTPETLISKVLEALNSSSVISATLDLEGLPVIRERVHALLNYRRRAA